MQSQLTLKLFALYSLKLQMPKKKKLLYFYNNIVLPVSIAHISYKHLRVKHDNPFFLYLHIVLPFFAKLMEQNHLIFFKTFQSFKKINKSIIKKNEKRLNTNKGLNFNVHKKKTNNSLIFNSYNFWFKTFYSLSLKRRIPNSKTLHKSATKATKKLYNYSWLLQTKTKQNKDNLALYKYNTYLNYVKKTNITKTPQSTKLKKLESNYVKVLQKQKHSKITYRFRKQAIQWFTERKNHSFKTEPSLLKKLQWTQTFSSQHALKDSITPLISNLNLNNKNLNCFLTFKTNALLQYKSIKNQKRVIKLTTEKQSATSKPKILHEVKKQKQLLTTQSVDENASTGKKPNILELVREKKKKTQKMTLIATACESAQVEKRNAFLSEKVFLINPAHTKLINKLKVNKLKIKKLKAPETRMYKLKKLQINKKPLSTARRVWNTLLTHHYKKHLTYKQQQSPLFKVYLVNQFKKLVQLSKRVEPLASYNKFYNFLKFKNQHFKQPNNNIFFGMYSSGLYKLQTMRLKHFTQTLKYFNTKTFKKLTPLLLLANANNNYVNKSNLKYCTRNQLTIKYRMVLLNSYKLHAYKLFLKKNRKITTIQLIFKFKKNKKQFSYQNSLMSVKFLNLNNFFLLKKNYIYKKTIKQKNIKSNHGVRRFFRTLRKYLLIFKNRFKKFRTPFMGFYLRNKKKLNKNKWTNIFNHVYDSRKKLVVTSPLKLLALKLALKSVNAQTLKINKTKQRNNYLKLSTISHYLLDKTSFSSVSFIKTKQKYTVTGFQPKSNNLTLTRTGIAFFNKFITTKNIYFSSNWLHDHQLSFALSNKSKHKISLNAYISSSSNSFVQLIDTPTPGLELNCSNRLRLLKTNSTFLINKLKIDQNIKYGFLSNVFNGLKQPSLAPIFTLNKTQQTKILKYSKPFKNYGPDFQFTAVAAKPQQINKNIFLQKKNNLSLKTTRFLFINHFIAFNNIKQSSVGDFELYRARRILRRFWPMQTGNKQAKHYTNRAQNKENFLINLKNIYTIGVKTLNKNILTTPTINKYQLQCNYIPSNLEQLAPQTNSINKDVSFDVAKKFIQILWKAQKYHKHVFQKQTLCNRWRFKKKFWVWFKKVRKGEPLTFKQAFKALPSLTSILSQTNFFYTKQFLNRLLELNAVCINGLFVKHLHSKILLGDIIQLSPNIKSLENFTSYWNTKRFAQLKFTKNIKRVITVSQWRQRKEKQPDLSNNFLRYNGGFIPHWTQTDFFISALTPVKYPKTLLGVRHEAGHRYMLDKLTPWRLKI